MKILVGYRGGEAGRQALILARDFAVDKQGLVYILNSMVGGASETTADIRTAKKNLAYAEKLLKDSGVDCQAIESVKGLSPGEDMLFFASEKDIDHIFIGVHKKSAVEKALLGSNARHVILNAPCPVTTVTFKPDTMTMAKLLKDRHILVVDDEPDVLETARELLGMCRVDTADSFEAALPLLKANHYDIAVLDIMGVNGYELLERCRKKAIPALMLTAHALTPENLVESIQKGADAYIPKDELPNLDQHVGDAVKHVIAGKKGAGAWISKLKPIFDKAFGKGWQDKEKEFWRSVK